MRSSLLRKAVDRVEHRQPEDEVCKNNWNAGTTRMPRADRARCSGLEAVVVVGALLEGAEEVLKIPQPLDEMPLLF